MTMQGMLRVFISSQKARAVALSANPPVRMRYIVV
jgi:hypothetical protein